MLFRDTIETLRGKTWLEEGVTEDRSFKPHFAFFCVVTSIALRCHMLLSGCCSAQETID